MQPSSTVITLSWFVKPLDEKLLREIFSNHDRVITVEDGCITGGFGSAVVEWMAQNGFAAKVKMLGIPDRIVEHGSQGELHSECDFDAKGIYEASLALLEPTVVK